MPESQPQVRPGNRFQPRGARNFARHPNVVNAVEQSPEQFTDEAGSSKGGRGGGKSVTSSPYMFLALCALLIPLADAQRPMLCPANQPGHVFQFPQSPTCNLTGLDKRLEIIHQDYMLYQQNVIEYKSDAFLCFHTKASIRLKTWLFGIEHEKEESLQDIKVTPSECQTLVDTKVSPSGSLTQLSSGLWSKSNSNKLSYTTPSWIANECCRWWEYSVHNYYIIAHQVLKYHDHNVFQSTAIDASSCNYFTGRCQLGVKALVWKPILEAQCKYINNSVVSGRLKGNILVANSGMLALTNTLTIQ